VSAAGAGARRDAARERRAGTLPARLRAGIARVPRAARVCMLVAVLNAVAWSLVTPPFHVVDEPWHYEYVEYMAEHWRPPAPTPPRLSPSVQAVTEDLDLGRVIGEPANGSVWSAAERRRLTDDLAHVRSRDGNGGSYADVPEPPLYYALEAIPFSLAKGASVLDRLALMRLLSALLAGVTVLGVFLFLREALPAHPWTWTVGALGVALLPLFALMAGGLNPDDLLYATAAWLFLLFARSFRRGFTPRRAAAIGALLAIGLLTKMNFVGLLPGALLGLVVLGVREEGAPRPRAPRLPLLALAVAAVPAVAIALLNVAAWDRPAFGLGAYSTSSVHPTLSQGFAYVWELYLPPLPGMTHVTATTFSTRDVWFDGFVGRFGWLDTRFAGWVYDAAAIPALAVLALCARALVRGRRALRARLAELAVYAALAAGMLALVAAASYNLFLQHGGGAAEARYLLPLLPLYGALLVLAARGAGRRWAPVAGTAIVMLAIAHNAFGLLLEISRFYA
jgi:4-amino-4-deoxy-L-arabinose transferase-like glycosyltransferase